MPNAHIQKFRYVDQARGIAILMVIGVHVAQKTPSLDLVLISISQYLQMGVQLFFVASAYTLCNSYDTRKMEILPQLSFYIRRIFRIAPLYYVGILVYFSLHLARQLADGEEINVEPYSLVNILSNTFFLHGFFPPANNNIVPGGWSIGTEVAFYAIFPIVFKFFSRLRGSKMVILPISAALLVNIILQYSITHSTAYVVENNSFMYFNLLNQLPVFLLGVGYYFIREDSISFRHFFRSKSTSLIGFLIFTLIAIFIWKFRFGLSFILIPTISGISFVFLLNLLKLNNSQNNILATIGKISYSMYVFHFIFAWYIAPTLFSHTAFHPVVNFLLIYIFSVSATFLLARFTERTIESTGISAGRWLIQILRAKQQ